MIQLLSLHFVAALLAPTAVARFGRRAFLFLAAAPASAALWALAQLPGVLNGDYPAQRVEWVSGLNLVFSLRLDALSLLMVSIVGGIGALVLVYCSPYFARSATGLGRFAGVFTAFAGSMLGLVISDNTLIMFLFWEFTTVFSFLLIGHYHRRQPSRAAARQAIAVTTLGGLAMLVGLIILGEMPGGSYSFTGLLEGFNAGSFDVHSTLVSVAVACVLAGALSKSAQFPLHFWLPSAMAAPTPVSAYLHAAAMVKAGVYLIARLAPVLSDNSLWRVLVLCVGGATMLLGGFRALRQWDLKLLLAFGTVSQLGLITMLVGYGDSAVATAGLAMLAAHSLFKSTLFLTVGIIDLSTGTRDLRKLAGLAKHLPAAAVFSGLAAASMAGLPPFAGFLAKESALHALLALGTATGRVTVAAVVAGSIMTVAYSARFWWGAFMVGPAKAPTEIKHPPLPLVKLPILILGASSLAVGFLGGPLERLLNAHAANYRGNSGHLVLWSGLNLPLALTSAVIVGGVALFWARGPIAAATGGRLRNLRASRAYRASLSGLETAAAAVTSVVQRGSLPSYLAVVLVTVMVAALPALTRVGTWPRIRPWDNPIQAIAGIVIIAAAVVAARSRRRIKAVIALGVAGYGIALLYELHGAPDLALTQVLVETITLVVFVLVLRRLPPFFSERPLTRSRYVRAILGIGAGVSAALWTVAASGARVHERVTVLYPGEAYQYGYGKNIVNVTLVDIRAWDTMGEISVLLAAATGVASLVFLRMRMGSIDRYHGLDRRTALKMRVWEGEGNLQGRVSGLADQPGRVTTNWLPGMATVTPQRRSLIMEIGSRMVFYPLIIFSLFLLFSGHNAPGGGFAGGLTVGIALTVRYLAGGRFELGEAAPFQAGHVLGAGLALAVTAGVIPLFFGGTILQTTVFDINLGPIGAVHLATALFFDIGVYLLVVGLVLDILRSQGAEIDRHGEISGDCGEEIEYDNEQAHAAITVREGSDD